jgi:hypothetical protein
LRYSLEYLHEKDIPIYYIDEASFSARNYQNHCWSNKGQNIKVDFAYIPKFVSCCVAMNEYGILSKVVKRGGILKEDYWAFLYQMRADLGHEKTIGLYADGLSAHHSKKTYQVMQELNIIPLKSIGYTSKFNCVE